MTEPGDRRHEFVPSPTDRNDCVVCGEDVDDPWHWTIPDMVPTSINGRWELLLPRHRAERPEWPYWEAARLAAMRPRIGPGSVVWDVGAEEGDLSALWSLWGADVVLAEPNPKVWPNIKAIWQANDLRDPLLCWPGFFSDTATAHLPALDTVQGPWPPCADGPVIGDHGFCRVEERPDLPAITIDALLAHGFGTPPTVLTMDVEGAELHVLRGALATLDHYRPDVFVSIHPEFLLHHYGVPDGVEVVCAFMADLGYEAEFLAQDHEHHWWFHA